MIGKTVSHFRIGEKLGEGGMGVVYKAEDLTLGRTVALKFLPLDSVATEQDRSRLVHEARAAAALLHPNICPIYEVSECDGRAFIAMAYIEGKTLRERISEGALPLDEALSIARQVGEALAAAHEKEVIHRDVKPANVMLTPEGRAVLMDFGLAKVSGRTKLTVTGTTVGTLAYMSPEQVQGEVVDHRADLWAVGAVLYEMVAGRPPFRDEYEAALLYSIVNSEPEALSSGRAAGKAGSSEALPAGLDGVMARVLAKDPVRRYQSARELVADLRVLSQDREALPAGRARPVRGLRRVWRRWHLWERVAAVASLSLLAAVLLWAGFKFLPGRSEAIDSIGILPLTNLSGDPAKEVWAEGVTDQLSTCMGTIGSLRVISHQSMKQFKGSTDPLPVIGRKVGVKALVEGSLMLVGDKITITVKLFDAVRDRMIWSNTFSGDSRNVMILQSRIAREVAGALKTKVTAQNEDRFAAAAAVDPMAYESYLQGRQFFMRYELKKAVECLQRSLAIDSTFALAWAGLARVYTTQTIMSEITPLQGAPLARAAVIRALECDDQLAESRAALSAVKMNFDWDWAGCDVESRRAVELNPGSPEVIKARRMYCYYVGRNDEMVELQKRVCDLQPLNDQAIGDLGHAFFYARRYAEAIAQFRKAAEMSGSREWNGLVAAALYFSGKHAEALAACDANQQPGAIEAFVYARLGRRGRAEELLAVEKKRWDGKRNPIELAIISAGLGDKDGAFAWIRRGLDDRWPEMLQFPTEPYYDDLRSDPRWQELLKLIHYPGSES